MWLCSAYIVAVLKQLSSLSPKAVNFSPYFTTRGVPSTDKRKKYHTFRCQCARSVRLLRMNRQFRMAITTINSCLCGLRTRERRGFFCVCRYGMLVSSHCSSQWGRHGHRWRSVRADVRIHVPFYGLSPAGVKGWLPVGESYLAPQPSRTEVLSPAEVSREIQTCSFSLYSVDSNTHYPPRGQHTERDHHLEGTTPKQRDSRCTTKSRRWL